METLKMKQSNLEWVTLCLGSQETLVLRVQDEEQNPAQSESSNHQQGRTVLLKRWSQPKVSMFPEWWSFWICIWNG